MFWHVPALFYKGWFWPYTNSVLNGLRLNKSVDNTKGSSPGPEYESNVKLISLSIITRSIRGRIYIFRVDFLYLLFIALVRLVGLFQLNLQINPRRLLIIFYPNDPFYFVIRVFSSCLADIQSCFILGCYTCSFIGRKRFVEYYSAG